MLLPAGYSDMESTVDTVTVGRTGEDTVYRISKEDTHMAHVYMCR